MARGTRHYTTKSLLFCWLTMTSRTAIVAAGLMGGKMMQFRVPGLTVAALVAVLAASSALPVRASASHLCP